ncbi:zinc finger protein jing-like, partial [Teleopsis dalmanni]|uniref:zinc finger protein jing-like n=1 Tax=Teleopsis dalmanni TaxID=139649 RepID=UPI0018CDFA31
MAVGVATSLSCTDSSTGSSEDASEPGSPYSPHSNLGDDQQQHVLPTHSSSNSISHCNKSKMPPQTILAPNSSSNSNSNNNTSTSSTNSSNSVPAHSTAAGASTTNSNSNNISNNSNNNNNALTTAKLKSQTTQPKVCTTTTPRNTLPSLQWNRSATTAPTIGTAASAQLKKRSAINTSSDGATKKSRSSVAQVPSVHDTSAVVSNNVSAAAASKRLKASALEESQTKITGYFKSQMKAQIHQNGSIKKPEPLAPTTSTPTNALTTSTLTMAPATTASLNKYFNILSQLKENSKNSEQTKTNSLPATTTTTVAATSSSSFAATTAPTAIITPPTLTPANTMPIPALKKIERSKPTKIAQVAPNLRKTPSNNYTASSTGKSPAKKHVAIAPRTPEMKQQQQQQQLQQQTISGKGQECAKQVAPTTAAQVQTANQPAVLLTAIRLAAQQPQQPQPQLKPVTSQKLNAPTTTTATATNNSPTLFQLPVQLPNLVQLPQLLAANGTNIMQLNNVAAAAAAAKTAATTAAATSAQAAQAAAAQYFLNGTVFKLQQFTTATTTTATSAVAATSAATNPFNLLSASDLQELLLKQQQQQQLQLQQQQQKAAAAVATNSNNFQEIFQQQIAAAIAANQQQQQQFQQLQRLGAAANIQQQPVFMATPAGLLLNAASLPAMLAQAAAALAVNNSQQQQKSLTLQQPQQLPALQPIQPNPLPALSSIFAPSGQQQQQPQTQHDVNELQQQFQHQQQLAQLALAQQQFITATQPPPLSAVTISNSNSNTANISNISNCGTTVSTAAPQSTQTATAKLAIVKATTNQQFPALSSQPPPLVTISNGKARTHATTPGNAQSKPSALAKPYQKRAPKLTAQAKAIATANTNKTKITANGKIIATPTTPPPLVPASCGVVANKELATIRATTVTKPNIPNVLPTPALVSIASPTTSSVKLTQSIAPATIIPAAIVPATIVPAIKPMQLPQLSAAKAIAVTTSAPTSTQTVTAVQTATATSVSMPDPFDMLKNSLNTGNLLNTTVCANYSNSNSSSTLSAVFNSVTCDKIKDEPLDEITTSMTAVTTPLEDIVKKENLTSFSGQILPADIKEEFMEDNTKMCASQSSNMHHECSSSSFSSNSNFVSSAADLSLEASIPPPSSASSSCSPTPSPAPSPLAAVNSPRHSPTLQQSCAATLNVVDTNSNSSNSLSNSTSCSHASSQDMLSELVTSSCISSAASSVSNMTITTLNNESKEADEDKRIINIDKRDLPTPESGIGGSLTNSESSSSIVSEMISNKNKTNECNMDDTMPTAADSTCTDTMSPPPTPLTSNNSNSLASSDNSLASNAPSPASPTTDVSDSCNTSVINSPVANTPNNTTPSTPTTIDIKLAEDISEKLPKCAISPILSQPKTIRFPAESGHRYGPKGAKRHDGVCYWDKCNKKHDSNSKLLDHMQTHHVNTQTGPFSCLWVGCKVYNKESCSRRWLERHVLSHGGSKQFKCIVEGCGLRFGSQLALQKHVNNHFTATENKESTNKRTSDPPVPKQLRKNGKKLRYRRQPFSARMFDFFDAGIMEGLQHRLRQISSLAGGQNSITFRGHCLMRRTTFKGEVECFVRWSPHEIIDDEWLAESKEPYIKVINIKHMKTSEKIKVESLLRAAYKLPYSPNLFENDFTYSQHIIENKMIIEDNVNDGDNDNDNDNDDDDDDD